ncbi:MAG: CapA family protein [Mariniphaga sp.]|nr:CapA family protein [Mariniphaga sp.]
MNFFYTTMAFIIIMATDTVSGNTQYDKRMSTNSINSKTASVQLFLCGDVMTGRGIDQALPHPVHPVLYESWVKNAQVYLKLAEQKNGKIEIPVSWDYIWGDAMKIWDENQPNLKLINLETSITTFPEPWPGKGINYRMNPKNIQVLKVAGIDHCSLANNHTLDWGRPGLKETLKTLETANIRYSGAGMNSEEAAKPSVFHLNTGRVLVFSYVASGSGVPEMWQAKSGLPGVNFLPGLGETEISHIKQTIEKTRKAGDVVVFSIHWGGNWGYSIPAEHREFAHNLLDEAGVDLIFGHSSHHPLSLEVYNNKLIIYGAGDFINDYEGISGHEEYRGELTLMYFLEIDINSGQLKSLKMVPMKMKNFRLNYPKIKDVRWLQKTLDRESQKLGARVQIRTDNFLWLK